MGYLESSGGIWSLVGVFEVWCGIWSLVGYLESYLELSSSLTSFSLSLKHCSEFIVLRTSASISSTDGITEVYKRRTASTTEHNTKS